MTATSSFKVVDTSSGTSIYWGTWDQCVRHCVKEKLAVYHTRGWLGQTLKLREPYKIERLT